MRKLALGVAAAALAAAAAGLFITRPVPLMPDALAGLAADAERGRMVFTIAGCASCHENPDNKELLGGGQAFASDFGTFYAPNISSDVQHGVGGWSDVQLASAIMRGVSADGAHLYPAFPYTSYSKANLGDVADLVAYMRTLPADPTPSRAHDVGFPFNQRWTLGGWKLLFARNDWVLAEVTDAQIARGRYLVESLGHCTECHTERNLLGGLKADRWLAGAPNPSGRGRIPNITPAALTWSAQDIAGYLASGMTPEFDFAGGEMAAVIRNTSQLPDADRAAIAAYLKAIPAIANP